MFDKKPLGCLTPLAITSALISILVLGIVFLFSGYSMFSPGNLYDDHIEETSNTCTECHAPFWTQNGMTERCLLCHNEIAAQITDKNSLHGVMVAGKTFECQACHTDHNGLDANLTHTDLSTFSHDKTGFSLTKHKSDQQGKVIDCVTCHANDFSDINQLTCLECHKDMKSDLMSSHVETFGQNCIACHDGVDRFSDFDHDQTGLPLSGEHKELNCGECHSNARTLIDLGTQNGSCGTCHSDIDPHRGQFGDECELCHSTNAWEPADFDHNKFNFALTGAHTQVECESCHTLGYIGTPSDCYACHQKDDEHNGSFGTQCEACHDTSDWDDAIFDHSKSAFPLNGAHYTLDCEKCHTNNVYAGTPTQCAACHTDPEYHKNMFAGQDCSTCHSDFTWRPAKFDQPHSFPINHGEEGGQRNTCDSCHQPTLTTWTCYTCHNQASMVSEHREEGITDLTNCIECHPTGREKEGGRGGND